MLAPPVFAQDDCPFSFEIDAQSSAFQALVEGAQARGGFWRPIREAPDDVQQMAGFIGRLDICLMTPDGKPATVETARGSKLLDSPHVTSCTAALLPDNRLLTNVHCFYDPTLVRAGFTIVAEAQINFGYVSKDFTDEVRSYRVSTREVAMDRDTDAMVLQIIGADANAALGGHIPMQMEEVITPREALTMIHHPRGDPLQFSSGTCQVAPEQAELPETASQLRHICETAGGSSGALLLDSRTLAVVGLHNQGGLNARGGYNSAHKIAAVEKALKLGFRPFTPAPVAPAALAPSRESLAQAALTEAFQAPDEAARRAALQAVLTDFPDSRAAASARNALALMAPKPKTTEEQATDLLLAALKESDAAQQRPLLQDILARFPGTAAAQSATSMLALLTPRPVAAPKPVPAPVPVPAGSADAVYDGQTLRIGGTVFVNEGDIVVVAAAPGDSVFRTGDKVFGIGSVETRTTQDLVDALDAAKRDGTNTISLNVLRVLRTLDINLPVPDQIVMERGPSQADAKTLKVAQDGSGDFDAIAQAVAAAKPGTRIEIYPGTYVGGVEVDKELELVGVGDRDRIIWEAQDENVIRWTAPSGRIANLTLRQRGSADFGAVQFSKGVPVLETCDLTSNGGPVVSIIKTADPVLRNNIIRDAKMDGVFVHEGGRGTLVNNEITGNGRSGVSIFSGGDPVLRNNVIGNGKRSGVLVFKYGRGTLEGNEIFGNALAGVGIGTGGDPVLRKNVIRDGNSSGVYVYDDGRGTLEGNEIFGNALDGVFVLTGGDPVLRFNVITRNGRHGVRIDATGKGTYIGNDLLLNKQGAFNIAPDAGEVKRRDNLE
ncbi:right-handed parallel beta-helix repeat-containing protein [Maliponia aquimaris]|uniref:right-handed parallel beta-helix repeat-containing protein n=1 Tax=Maliponia aquimaris TaxID=1673631 RepID=UPI0015960575|nr:right-handed parallel beta-helix repeat-containing protein [Maliponia aquimaris]